MAEFIRLPDFAMAALRTRDAAGLPAIGLSQMHGSDRIVAISPDEWLIIAADGEAEALCARHVGADRTVIDVSGSRVCYAIAGANARCTLSAGCSLDLDGLGPGKAVSTLLARAQVVVVAVEEDDGFLVLPRRSFGSYLEQWFATIA